MQKYLSIYVLVTTRPDVGKHSICLLITSSGLSAPVRRELLSLLLLCYQYGVHQYNCITEYYQSSTNHKE
jgi:hypothetical protein